MFAGTDACVTPVLTFGEVAAHPHLAARGDDRRPGRGAAGRPGAALLPHRHRGPGPAREPEDVESVLADWT